MADANTPGIHRIPANIGKAILAIPQKTWNLTKNTGATLFGVLSDTVKTPIRGVAKAGTAAWNQTKRTGNFVKETAVGGFNTAMEVPKGLRGYTSRTAKRLWNLLSKPFSPDQAKDLAAA